MAQSRTSYSLVFPPLYRPTATLRYESVNAFITMFIKVMGSTAAHYFAERKNSNR